MGSGSTQTETVSGASETETTISDLMPSTNYSIDVAAINNVGTGVYNDPLTTVTDGMKYKNTVVCIVSCFVDLFSVSVNTSSNTSLTLSLRVSLLPHTSSPTLPLTLTVSLAQISPLLMGT